MIVPQLPTPAPIPELVCGNACGARYEARAARGAQAAVRCLPMMGVLKLAIAKIAQPTTPRFRLCWSRRAQHFRGRAGRRLPTCCRAIEIVAVDINRGRDSPANSAPGLD